jgi:hypothetical protein
MNRSIPTMCHIWYFRPFLEVQIWDIDIVIQDFGIVFYQYKSYCFISLDHGIGIGFFE